ncbi:hypothetical protein PMAYCL1PPCAC_29614 [Pristionchus mayeri]|uniref:Uncharacterized protein n=1 Tax=Pristionchus mayeri TaxID=1317129 RepID=A0AAN5DAD4_9BILA|nr:hypothetical protein PMAYCL1PPCAC_29614 [Pristionchus mayeri]
MTLSSNLKEAHPARSIRPSFIIEEEMLPLNTAVPLSVGSNRTEEKPSFQSESQPVCHNDSSSGVLNRKSARASSSYNPPSVSMMSVFSTEPLIDAISLPSFYNSFLRMAGPSLIASSTSCSRSSHPGTPLGLGNALLIGTANPPNNEGFSTSPFFNSCEITSSFVLLDRVGAFSDVLLLCTPLGITAATSLRVHWSMHTDGEAVIHPLIYHSEIHTQGRRPHISPIT